MWEAQRGKQSDERIWKNITEKRDSFTPERYYENNAGLCWNCLTEGITVYAVTKDISCVERQVSASDKSRRIQMSAER